MSEVPLYPCTRGAHARAEAGPCWVCARMWVSLQSFLREGRVVGPCWEELKPKGPQGLQRHVRG